MTNVNFRRPQSRIKQESNRIDHYSSEEKSAGSHRFVQCALCHDQVRDDHLDRHMADKHPNRKVTVRLPKDWKLPWSK